VGDDEVAIPAVIDVGDGNEAGTLAGAYRLPTEIS